MHQRTEGSCLTGSSLLGWSSPSERSSDPPFDSPESRDDSPLAAPVAIPPTHQPSFWFLYFYALVPISSAFPVNLRSRTFSQTFFQKYKMLRTRRQGLNPSSSTRTNLDISAEIVRAVKGDALIHGPNMAARPVGSDWRTRRPSQLIQTYC